MPNMYNLPIEMMLMVRHYIVRPNLSRKSFNTRLLLHVYKLLPSVLINKIESCINSICIPFRLLYFFLFLCVYAERTTRVHYDFILFPRLDMTSFPWYCPFPYSLVSPYIFIGLFKTSFLPNIKQDKVLDLKRDCLLACSGPIRFPCHCYICV